MDFNQIANVATAVTAIVALIGAIIAAIPTWRKIRNIEKTTATVEADVKHVQVLVNSAHNELVQELRNSQQYNKALLDFLRSRDLIPPTDQSKLE